MFLCSKANLLEADVWKEFLARPSLPYVLRLLSGLCKGHSNTQVLFYFDLFKSPPMGAALYVLAKPQYFNRLLLQRQSSIPSKLRFL